MRAHQPSSPQRVAPFLPGTSVSHKPRITVVITNFNRREDLREALQSVRQQDYPDVAIIVIDNASDDGSCDMLEAEFPEVHLVSLSENLGMAGYSVGFERAESALLFQMDNDSMMPDDDVLTRVVERFVTGPPELATVACRVEELQPGVDDLDRLRGRDGRRGPIDTGGFHSGGVGFRKTVLDEVGGYSREVFLYGSELFLQMKLLAHGHQIHYFPEILMLHKSSGAARSSLGIYFELRNRYWFMRRFASSRQRLHFLPAMLLHDAVYALAGGRPGAFVKALRDGFAAMPGDLRRPLRSSRPEFVAKVEEVGHRFGPAALLGSIVRRLRHVSRALGVFAAPSS